MSEKEMYQNDMVEIDLRRLFDALLKKAYIISFISILGAVAAFLITYFVITPKYQSSAMFYVNNSSISVGSASLSISSGDLVTSRNLVESYLVILNTRETLNDVIDYSGVDRTYSEVKNMLSAAAVNETEIFEVVVTSSDPVEAEKIASAISYILPKRIGTIIEGTSAKIVDSAVVASKPSSPSFTKNTLLGFLLALLATVAIIVFNEVFDTTIRRVDDIVQLTKLPILAAVPDMLGRSKGGYYKKGYYSKGSYGGYNNKRKQPMDVNAALIGSNVPFAASEAYKLLRTKVQYSFADDNVCHVIGVSSALSGEGKSTTSVNLAYSLAQLNLRVLLVDCDLRRPSVAAKLGIDQKYGLSGVLTRQCGIEQAVQSYTLGDEVDFTVVPAGPIPPNPTELLNSPRMERFMEKFARSFDYVILDLPPVEEVSDALVAAKLADGVLLAVRQDYCNRRALEDTIQQFEFVDGKLIGVLMTCAKESGIGYGKSYYKRYYRRYGKYRSYAKAYEQSYMESRENAESNEQ